MIYKYNQKLPQSISDIKTLGERLHDLRMKIDTLQAEMDALKALKGSTQIQLIEALTENGLKSIKTFDKLYSLAEKLDPQIEDQNIVINELEKRGLKDEIMPPKLDMVKLKQYTLQLFKEGEFLAGMLKVKIKEDGKEKTSYNKVRYIKINSVKTE